MVYGIRALRQIRFAKETTAGTAVATATAIWRGEGVLTDEVEIVHPPEDAGQFQALPRHYIPKIGATIEFSKTPATFEQLPYIFLAGIDGSVTGTVDGTGGSDYIYAFTLGNTAAKTPATYTMELGDNARADEAEYGFVESFTLEGAKGDAVYVSAKWRGRQALDCEFTGSLSAPTVEEILFQKGKLYLHATTFGSGQITASWLGFTVEVKTGFQAIWTGDGNKYFTVVKQIAPEVTGSLVLEHDANGEAEITAARAMTTRHMRMTFEGTVQTIAGSGSAWTYKALQMDIAMRYTAVPPLSEEDGDDTVELPWSMVYDASGGVFTVVNELSALP